MEDEIDKNNFCFKYLENSPLLYFKIVATFIMAIFLFYLLIDSVKTNDSVIIIFSMLFANFIAFSLVYTIYIRLKYDEICIKDDLLIIKEKNNIINKYKIKDILRTSFVSRFALNNNPSIHMYIKINGKNRRIFHYMESEVDKKYVQILNIIFKKQTKEKS